MGVLNRGLEMRSFMIVLAICSYIFLGIILMKLARYVGKEVLKLSSLLSKLQHDFHNVAGKKK